MEPASLYLGAVLGVLVLWLTGDGIFAVAHAIVSRPTSRRTRSTQLVAAGVGLMITLMSWRAAPVVASVVPQQERTMIEVDQFSPGIPEGTLSPSFALTNRVLQSNDMVMSRHEGASPTQATHTVVSGDCLWRIARSTLRASDDPISGASIGALWREIYDLNRDVIGSNPNLIFPGQVLVLPER